MPFINAKIVKGVLSTEERSQLITRLTDVVVDVFARGNEELRPAIWVVVDEVEPDQWAVGGGTVDLATVRRLTGREP